MFVSQHKQSQEEQSTTVMLSKALDQTAYNIVFCRKKRK